MSTTGQTIVANALKLLGVYQAGETPSANDAADGFASLNSYVNLLAIQGLTINGIQRFDLTVVPSHQPYTLGVGGDFNQVRPTWIDDVTITQITATPTTIPVAQLNADQWANLAAKTVESQVPTNWYYNPTYTIATPLGGLYFWPIPNSAQYQLNIWVPVAITEFTTPTTSYTLLPGWQVMLENNLAVYLSSSFGVQAPPMVALFATQSMTAIKMVNVDPGLLGVDGGLLKPSALQGGGNWLSGPVLFLAARLLMGLFS